MSSTQSELRSSVPIDNGGQRRDPLSFEHPGGYRRKKDVETSMIL